MKSGLIDGNQSGDVDQESGNEPGLRRRLYDLAAAQLAKIKPRNRCVKDGGTLPTLDPREAQAEGPSQIAICSPVPQAHEVPEREFLLGLARKTLVGAVTEAPVGDPEQVPSRLLENLACFVTLTKHGSLRGCIGQIVPRLPLYLAVIENTQSAAFHDPRFPPVERAELNEIRIEISILTEPQVVPFTSPEQLLSKLQPREDGVLLQIGGRVATFLPQVWGQVSDKDQFLSHLAQKAGCAPSAWRDGEATISVYHAEHFQEDD